MSDLGRGDLGGCGRHAVCSGGTSPGRLCNLLRTINEMAAECGPGGLCADPGNAASPAEPQVGTPFAAGLCYKSGSYPAQQPFNPGCLPPGDPKRLVDRALPANVCP